ncbi:caspase-10 isoform X1 [Molossus molossus]|uniref:Caspase 10 n=1 Tax=Molossus molossus TaxID=27622 RepID=A0A7J8FQ07_MOLMO|nr:caspase-10 isoform X1 [Molossus molossus]XP_036109896.1 caspase-10 isoform X1 [Molossus molossus]XP_036109897.1 caspase-10 isoform X1 [Molossus molossus]XP_036109898.1 caspase-10 isoform X1 [Molossus molossus]XP_036109899.1 caspase-10 isoform X1 [Molossus molossus]KAF6449768.1 caspase 10 [Molossus molossus]
MSFQVQSRSSSSDDNGIGNFRRRLLNIDSNLGDQAVEKLKFLCRDFVSHKKLERSRSALDIFDHLMTEDLLSEKDPFLLAELLCIMQHSSLLKYLNCTKEQVKRLLPTQKKVSLFRKLLYELSEDIDSEDLKDMIFLVRESLPKVQMTSLSFLEHLEKQAQIDADNLTLLENLCKTVASNLMRKIEKYKCEKEAEQSKLRASEVAVSAPAPTCCVPGAEGARGLQEENLLSGSDFQQSLILTEETMYRMDRKHRGFCVIINNRSFNSLSERKGTNKDAECLKLVFQWLGFIIDIYDNVTKSHLEKVLQKYKRHPDHADGDCFVFCVLTHGRFGAVYSSDEALIPIREIMSHFTAQQCPSLANKPKLFFIQACQGEEIQSSVSIQADAINPEPTDPPLEDSVPVEADFLLGLATVPGYVSFRHKTKGSWYIQALCKYLKDYVPKHEDILSILTAVNDNVSRQGETKKQMPQPVFTLRKKVIFPVPQKELLLESFHCS